MVTGSPSDGVSRAAELMRRHHVTHLIVHAILHLAGYDHEADADAETMEDAERSILAGLGIPDPYHES